MPGKDRLHAETKGFVVIAVAVALAVTALSFLFRDDLVLFRDRDALFILSIIVAYYPAILVHEVGHVLAGWLVHFRLHQFMVGPLAITRRGGGRPHFGFASRSNWLNGRVLMMPLSPGNLGSRKTTMILGGSAANFLVVAAAVLLDRARGPVGHTADWGTFALVSGSVESLYLGIQALIPYNFGPPRLPSDGWKLRALLRARPAASRLAAAWVLQGYHAAGYRSRDCPGPLVRLAADSPIPSRDGADDRDWLCAIIADAREQMSLVTMTQ